jgi:hypothetical protein
MYLMAAATRYQQPAIPSLGLRGHPLRSECRRTVAKYPPALQHLRMFPKGVMAERGFFLNRESRFSPLRKDPRFLVLLRRHGFLTDTVSASPNGK